MDIDQANQDFIKQIWSRNLDIVRNVLQNQHITDGIIFEALTYPHRDRYYTSYANDGNRSLAETGSVALNACIRQYTTYDGNKSQIEDWKRLLTLNGLHTVVANSRLRSCIISSIRQNSPRHQTLPSQKFTASMVRALIGAVYWESDRNIHTTSHSVNALASIISTTRSPAQPIRNHPSDRSANENDNIASFSEVELAMNYEASLNEMLNFDPETFEFDWSDCNNMTNGWTADTTGLPAQYDLSISQGMWSDDQYTLNPDCRNMEHMTWLNDNTSTTNITETLAKLTLSHTSINGQQGFVPVPQGQIEDVSLVTKTSSPATIKDKNVKRSGVDRDIDEYIKKQQHLCESTTPPGQPQASYSLVMDMRSLSQNAKHVTTMSIINHASVSAQRIIFIKIAFAACRTRYVCGEMPRPQELSKPTQYYRHICSLSEARAQNGIERFFYIYKLYVSLRGDFRTALDDGFVHHGRTAVASSGKPGNPIKKCLSKEYDNMLRRAVRDFDKKSVAEKGRLNTDLEKMRNIGLRLYQFVAAFGEGVICFIPFKTLQHDDDEDSLSFSETDFMNLTEKDLPKFITSLRNSHHPIAQFALAAKRVLRCITGEEPPFQLHFRFEKMDIAELRNMIGGSEELRSQLDST